jgi:DNA-damage-inducible protein J
MRQEAQGSQLQREKYRRKYLPARLPASPDLRRKAACFSAFAIPKIPQVLQARGAFTNKHLKYTMYTRGDRMASSMVHIRVDEKVKAKAARTLATMGLTVSDAVRLLLMRVAAEKAMPFEVRVPNRATRAAIEAGERGEVSRASSVAEMMKDLNAND